MLKKMWKLRKLRFFLARIIKLMIPKTRSGIAKLGTTKLGATKWPGSVKLRQQILKGFLVGTGCLVCVVVGFYLFRGQAQAKPDRHYKTNLTGGSDRLSPQKAWYEQITAKLDDITQRLSTLEGRSALPGHSAPQEISSLESHSTQHGPLSSQENENIQHNEVSSTDTVSLKENELRSQIVGALPAVPTTKRPHTAGIHHVVLSPPPTKTLKTGDNTIPAGAFAEAVLLGGVDASTSIQASSDPRPVLLRITNPGTLPRRFKSDLCGCHVLAACYGDISSERVFMRLEKITCTERQTGEIVEMNVRGYVAGEDGRAGLRGTVVDRAGESVRNAAVGGFIGGMAGFVSQANQNPVTYSLSSGLSQTPGLKGSDMLRQGAAKGAGNALDKYADFYIKRAEQMQPVIQVQAGRVVDIVTTESTPFEDSAERRSLIHINDRKRYEQIKLPVVANPPVKEGEE